MPRLSRLLARRCALAVLLSLAPVGAVLASTDDHPDDCSRARPLALQAGGRLVGTLENPGDIDAFALDLRPGHLYALDPYGFDLGTSTRIRIMTPDCRQELASFDPLTWTGRPWFLAPAPARPGVAAERLVALVDSTYGATGAYRATVDLIAGPYSDDHPSTMGLAQKIPADGQLVAGVLEFGMDRDTFAVEARPGGMYRLEIVRGLESGSELRATIYAPFREREPLVYGSIPADGCDIRPEGCSAVRVIAPEGEPSMLFINLQLGGAEDNSLPPQAYTFRIVDEGDFVPLQGSPECTDPGIQNLPLATPLAFDPPHNTWEFRSWSVNTRRDHVYRLSTLATFGQPFFDTTITTDTCLEALLWHDVSSNRRAYFRETADASRRLNIGRARQEFDPWDQPILGAVLLQLDDLGPVADDHPDQPVDLPAPNDDHTVFAGGRITSGTLEYGGDIDYLVANLTPGVPYRVEFRSLTPGGSASLVAFGTGAATNVFAPAPAPGAVAPSAFRGNPIALIGARNLTLGVESRPSNANPELPVRYQIRIIRAGCRADWDGSGDRSFNDLYAYLNDYFAGHGEFDGVGGAPSVGDLFSFVQAWFGSCE